MCTSSETVMLRRWASMTTFSKSHSPDSYSSMACASGATITVADSTAGFTPEDEVPADSQLDKAAPVDAGGRAGEPPDPAHSYNSLADRITIALIPRASNALLALCLLPLLCTI